MTRFYHLDPERVLEIPVWLFEALAKNIDRLAAREMLDQAAIVQLPWMTERERSRVFRQWRRIAYAPGDSREDPVAVVEDPEKARAWFERHGAVVRSRKEQDGKSEG